MIVAHRYHRDMKRLAIFDLDGTLADSFPWFVRMVNTVAQRHGFRPIRADDIEMLRGKDTRQILDLLEVARWKLPLIARDMRRMKSRAMADIVLFDGVEAMLDALVAKDITIALVSSDSETNARRALGGSTRFVSHFACGASLFGKAAKFGKVLRRVGIPAELAIAIGDEVRDGEPRAKPGWGSAR
jgi:phosphoglycolate phosphatase